jgi:tetratricopeptide (TPR) repeat protein
MSDAALHEDGSLDSLVGQVADEFLSRQKRGENPDVEEFVARYPHAAAILRNVLASLRLIDQSVVIENGEADAEAARQPQELGDFRIVREVGRGGMGIVYEAEQLSLGRKVALKVLPLAATLDPRRLQRFHNEARAAACLHHNHIVPVFSVGSDRGVHFYAMQLIEGWTLDAVIRDARPPEGEPTVPAKAESAPSTAPAAALSTVTPRRDAAYFRKVAELGAQAAEALDYAHQMGVIHRDVKPSNLMLDGRGQLWVTDFGLAQLQTDAGPTLTGDLVGTLRYMSPEQALAQRVPVDQRTDVYSLGATLYELLTLRPVFLGEDRQELLRQIAFDEPTPPRRLDRAIPAELETIVRKALEKSPQDRYATAQELADDLRRFLEDKPIRARRPSWRQVALKWARRHRPVVWAAAAVALVALVLGGCTAFWWAQKRAGAEASARAALKEAARLAQEEKWPEALGATKRARELLANVGADPNLRQEVEDLGKDLEMGRALQEASLRGAAVKVGYFDQETQKAALAAAFAWYGLDVAGLDPPEAAARIQSRPIRPQLVAALGEWAFLDRASAGEVWKHLLAICRLADPDPWHNQLRDAWERKDFKVVEKLLAGSPAQEVPRGMAPFLAEIAWGTTAADRAVDLLRQDRLRHPADFWVNHKLGFYLLRRQPPRLEEAVRYLSVAVALRPESPGTRLNLGVALYEMKRLDEAEWEFQAAIALDPKYAQAHTNLGTVLRDQKHLNEALKEFRTAIALDPRDARPHNNLGTVLYDQKQLVAAIAAYQQAIQLDSKLAPAHYNLGNALHANGQSDEAVVAYRRAIELDNKFALAHHHLGYALHANGQSDAAIAAYGRAIELDNKFAWSHNNLGNLLRERKQLDAAIEEYQAAIQIDGKFAAAYNGLGYALNDKGQTDAAIPAFKAAIALDAQLAPPHNGLGIALASKKQLGEAMKEFRKAIELDSKFATPHYNLGHCLLLQRRLPEAIREYREAIALGLKSAAAYNYLGNALRDMGELEAAIDEYERAIRLDKDDPVPHNGLGALFCDNKRDYDRAIAEFREAIRLKKDYATAHYNLGVAYQCKGQLDAAVDEYRVAVRLNYPLAHSALLRAEQLARLDKRLTAVLAGQDQPKDAAERIAFARHCQRFRKLNAAAVHFFAEGFAKLPALAEDLQVAHRYNAACAAALAGCGKGADAKDLDAKERTQLRQQALDWLRADLKAWRDVMVKGANQACSDTAKQMSQWLADVDFAGVRGPEALARLPKAERLAWQQLWADVANTLARSEETTARAKKPDVK